MKIFNVLYLAIKKTEFEFLVQRHNTDVQLYCEFDKDWEIRHVKHYEKGYTPGHQGTDQVFFRGNNSFFHCPWGLALYARRQQPDIVIAHSFKFAFQQFVLNFFLPKKTRIIVQHHGESPYKNPFKLWLQRRAFRRGSAFLFSSKMMADEFVAAGIIDKASLVHELPESSTGFHAKDKAVAREKLQLNREKTLFLWVGRLNANKDPMTVLRAFLRYSQANAVAELFMFYHEDDLVREVSGFIEANALSGKVHLMGRVAQKDLEAWYNACDYYISGSRYESTGYAFCEALACGCVPVATRIPSFLSLSDEGQCAILFEPGDVDDLYQKLSALHSRDYERTRRNGIEYFLRELSFEAISRKLAGIVRNIYNSAG